MILHAFILWPEAAFVEMRKFAIKHAVCLWNGLQNRSSLLSSIELISQTRWTTMNSTEGHVLGCPNYALDPKLADGKKIPKWQRCSRRCIFLGFSDQHSSNAGLILNMVKVSCRPQFHVVYVIWFVLYFSQCRLGRHTRYWEIVYRKLCKVLKSGHEWIWRLKLHSYSCCWMVLTTRSLEGSRAHKIPQEKNQIVKHSPVQQEA